MIIVLTCICDRELLIEYASGAELRARVSEVICLGWRRRDKELCGGAATLQSELDTFVAEAVTAYIADRPNLTWRCPTH